MNSVKPSTNSEKLLFKAIQKKIGASEDGILGTQSMCDIAVSLKASCFPITICMYNYPVIIGNDLIAFNPSGALSKYKNSMLGSFTYPRATTPCSILINDGKVVCGNSCHAHLNKPETVIYRLKDRTFGIKRCLSYSELPSNVDWAIGGMGLCDMYNPDIEGFSGSYADVLRKTNHNVLGIKNNMVYGVYYKNLTGQQINSHCKNTMKFEMAILLDGGGLAAMNGGESFAKINTSSKQGYAIQFI